MVNLDEVDKLYEEGKSKESFEKIQSIFKENNEKTPDLYYRMARHFRDMSSFVGAKDQKLSEEYIKKGFETIEEGKNKFPTDGHVNLWYGCFLDLKSRLDGINTRIKNSFIVKEHLESASEKLPDDFLANHSLGVWHYEVAAIPYVKRVFAKTIFSSPPESTYKAALPYLQKAYEAKKDKPYPGNLLYLVKCNYNLGNKADMLKYKSILMEMQGDDLDTISAKTEAATYK